MAVRAEKKRSTRQALIRVAHDLFLQEGFDRVTVDRITEAAGVSKRTFFRYFVSKLDVAFPFHEERLRHFEGLLARHLDPANPLQGVNRALAAYVGYFQESKDVLLEEFTYVYASRELRARDADLDEQFETAITSTLQRVGVPRRRARVLGGLVFGASRALLYDWLVGGCRSDLRRIARELLGMLDDIAQAWGPGSPDADAPAAAGEAGGSHAGS